MNQSLLLAEAAGRGGEAASLARVQLCAPDAAVARPRRQLQQRPQGARRRRQLVKVNMLI